MSHRCFSHTMTVLVDATVLLIYLFYRFGNRGTKKSSKFAQVSHQDNNVRSPGNPVFFFWTCNDFANAVLALEHSTYKLTLSQKVFKPADINSFYGRAFYYFFLFFYIHDVLWRDCLEICRIIIPIDIIQIFFFVSVFVSLNILCEKANKKTQPKSLIPPATIAQ